MEFLSAIVTKMLEYTVEPVGHQLGYLFHYRRNVAKLREELHALTPHKDRIIHQVDAARNKGEEIYEDVRDWLIRADSVISEEDRAVLLNEEHHAKGRCSSCSFPNLVLRYKLSKQAKEIANRVSEIKGTSFVTVSYRPALQNSIVVDKDYKGVATRKPVLAGIMTALKSPDVKMIGMYGMGGVGKTTLAKEIARQAKDEEKLFDKVIMVTISQTPDHKKIQREIAGALGLEFSNSETEKSTRADRLRQRLSQETNILIILDDVWEKINLFDDVGIEFNDGQNGCKILMTSRRQVLFKSMDVKEIFCVETLTKDEATELFCSVVGDLRESPDCECLLNELVSECGGLPLVINTVAAALKGESLHKWKTALKEMRKSAPKNIDDLIQQVYPRLKMSYNFLHGEAQSLLLLCSMFPEDTLIKDDYLLMYSVGWGIFNDIETVEDARDKMYTLIDTLRKNCLLLPSEESRFDKEYYWVKVHDVIRDVAISIAKEKGWFNISSITQLEENREAPIAISFLGKFPRQLSNMFLCPQLRSFIVPSKQYYFFQRESLPTIPDCLFEENKNLRVLDLPYVCLKSPPSSFSCLSDSLQTLRLIGCNLEDTTFIGDLKKLRCLDLSFSKFQILSKQIGQLTRLQLLALDYCKDLKVIEPTVISSLTHLEELYMREVKIKWEVESDNNRSHNASLAELKNLRRLSSLCIWIEEAAVMPKNLFAIKLKRYEIILGPAERHVESSSSKVLYLNLHESSLMYSSGLEKLIEESEHLRLSGLMDLEIFVRKVEDGIEFHKLRSLRLSKLPKLVQFSRSYECEIASSSSALSNSSLPLFNDKITFPILEELELSALDSVQILWTDNLAKVPSMQNLKTLRVEGCHRLKYLFSVAMARSFVHLEKLTVCQCKMMEEVLVVKEAVEEEGKPKEPTILFPKIKHLDLYNFPNLKRFYRGDLVIECPSLRYLRIEYCTKDVEETKEPLLSEKVAFPRLENLAVEFCGGLKYLLSYDMARSLKQLQSLKINYCDIMEEIVVIKEPFRDGRLKPISFSKLEYVNLYSLPSLKRFSSADCIECPSLKELYIYGCKELGKSNASLTPTPLIAKDEREVEERELVATQALFTQKLSETSCNILVQLEISFCDNIEYLFPLHLVESLAQLKKLKVLGCKIMEVVVEVTKEAREEGIFKKISFPKLESFHLHSLPRLKRFCAADCIACPSLFKLFISNCPELRTFTATSEFTPTPTAVEEEIGKRDLVAQLPMFNEKVEFPNLEGFTLYCSGTEILNETWPSQSAAVPFPKLKQLCLHCSEDRNWGVLPFDIHKYQNLEGISLHGFSCMENLEQHGETLGVESCGRLKTLLMSSSVTFKNLGVLRISKYHGIINVLASSTVKCLVQLKKMSIYECDQMTEIIVDKQGEAQSTEIAFTQLKTLVLHRLPTLKSFYNGNSNIQFPNLKEVIVSECPEMEKFSCGTIITSNLNTLIINTERIEEVRKGDLNTSIRTVWEDLHNSTKNSEEQTNDRQDVVNLKENIASSSSSKLVPNQWFLFFNL